MESVDLPRLRSLLRAECRTTRSITASRNMNRLVMIRGRWYRVGVVDSSRRPSTLMRALARPLTVVAALLCLGAQLSPALHMLLVEHVRCAQHGEWVHASHDPAVGEDQAGLRGGHSSHSELSAASEGGTSHLAELRPGAEERAHEHCLTCVVEPSASLRSSMAEVTLLEPPLTTARPALGVLDLGSSRRYMLAPKASPPAFVA